MSDERTLVSRLRGYWCGCPASDAYEAADRIEALEARVAELEGIERRAREEVTAQRAVQRFEGASAGMKWDAYNAEQTALRILGEEDA